MELIYLTDQFLLGVLSPSLKPTLKKSVETPITRIADRIEALLADLARSKITHSILNNLNLKYLNISSPIGMSPTIAKVMLKNTRFIPTSSGTCSLFPQEAK